jgi:L-iditol 2-dehydrogenase
MNAGRGADVVIVCTGAQAAFRQSLACVDRGGTVVCFATTEPGVDLAIPLNAFWRQSVRIMSSYAAAPNDLAIALELIRSGRVRVGPMLTHRLPLAETGRGFALMAACGESLKIVIEPQR